MSVLHSLHLDDAAQPDETPLNSLARISLINAGRPSPPLLAEQEEFTHPRSEAVKLVPARMPAMVRGARIIHGLANLIFARKRRMVASMY